MKRGLPLVLALGFIFWPVFGSATEQTSQTGFGESNVETSIAEMYNFEGNVSLVRDRRTILPDLDQRCQKGDLVRTEAGAFADVILNNTAGLRLLENTWLELNSIRSIETLATLKKGTLLINLNPIPDGATFHIETDSVIVNIKEGQYFVKASVEDGMPYSVVGSRKGNAYVTAKDAGATITVLEGQSVRVASDGLIPSVHNVDDDENSLLAKALTIYIPEKE